MASEDPFKTLSDIQFATDRETLLELFSKQVGRLGGRDFVVCSFPSDEGVTVAHRTVGFDQWIAAFAERNYASHCPMNLHTLTSRRPATFEAAQMNVGDNVIAREAVGVAREAGLCHGLLIPLHRRNGSKAGIAVSTDKAIEGPTAWMIYAVSLAFHARFEALLGHDSGRRINLSERERDILRWFADGKNASDVAAILGISQATIMFHYRHAAEKLGASNRTHAIALAMRQGVLDLHSKH